MPREAIAAESHRRLPIDAGSRGLSGVTLRAGMASGGTPRRHAAPSVGNEAEPVPRIIISNGFGRFPLSLAAAEMNRRGGLAGFITGGYPAPWLARLIEATGLSRTAGSLERLLKRAEPLPAQRVHALWTGEALYQVESRVRRASAAAKGAADCLGLAARGLYATRATRVVDRLVRTHHPGIYHYRSGFGGGSVDVARRHGWLCLCHHTIPHPAVLEYLTTHGGRLPPAGERGPIDRNWRAILTDVDRADHILTESEFVKSTFVHQGWEADKVDVIPQGIDDEFLSALPERVPADGPLRLLFAGAFCRRKGGPVLAEAISRLDDVDWRLDLCGPISPDAAPALGRLTADHRVTHHGMLPYSAVPALMAAADVFVFPTLAEGSARVQFEALAAGCYLVTTANGGSIVEDGEHGRLVAPGSVTEIAEALREAAMDRSRVARVGERNAMVVRRDYRQAHFGAGLFELYTRLLPRSGACSGG